MGPSGLGEVLELHRLTAEARGQGSGGLPNVGEGEERRHLTRRRERVVGRLAPVHEVVRTDRGVIAPGLAEDLERPVGQHLVDVHVERGARSRLEDVDHELVRELPVGDLAGRLLHGPAPVGVDSAEGHVGPHARELQQAVGPDEMGRRPKAAHREVVARPKRLDPPVRRVGDLAGAERILLDARRGHARRGGPADKTFRLTVRLDRSAARADGAS